MITGLRANGVCLAALLALVLLAPALTACGDEPATPGESPPKRALDPRGEVLRFFPVDTDPIVLVETADPEKLAALDRAMQGVPLWRTFRERLRRSLESAGIEPTRVLELSRNPAEDIELPTPEIAFGTLPGSGSEDERAQFALATEQGVALAGLFKEAAEKGGLEDAGEFDGARLYRGRDLDFAVRDGVLIAAADINRLQQAIARRDGDPDSQLDVAPVTALINELTEPGTLRAYIGPGPTADALLSLIADEAPEAAEAALAVRIDGDGALAIEVVVRTEEAEADEDEPAGEEQGADAVQPLPVSIGAAEVEAALEALPPSVSAGLGRPGPLVGAAWVDGDRYHARLITAPR